MWRLFSFVILKGMTSHENALYLKQCCMLVINKVIVYRECGCEMKSAWVSCHYSTLTCIEMWWCYIGFNCTLETNSSCTWSLRMHTYDMHSELASLLNIQADPNIIINYQLADFHSCIGLCNPFGGGGQSGGGWRTTFLIHTQFRGKVVMSNPYNVWSVQTFGLQPC